MGVFKLKTPRSEESFRAMHKELVSLFPANKKNQGRIIELIRLITEALIFSEQEGRDLFK